MPIQDIVTALDELHEGFAIFDRELRLTLCNQSFSLLTGLPQEMCRPSASLFDQFVFSAKRGDYGPVNAAAQASEQIAAIGRREPREVLVDQADGRKLLTRYPPIVGNGRVVIYEDVTESKQPERQAKETEAAIAAPHVRIDHTVNCKPQVKQRFRAPASAGIRTGKLRLERRA